MSFLEINWKTISKQDKIIQLYKKGVQFSLLSSEHDQCHPFVWCKDFLKDVVFSSVNNKEINLYNFKYSPQKDPSPCLSKLKILVLETHNLKFKNNVFNCIDFLNQIEQKIFLKKSKVLECKSPPYKSKVFYFEADSFWIRSPYVISFYCYLIRLGLLHNLKDNFYTTLEKVKLGFIKSFNKTDKINANFVKKIIESIHSNMFSDDIKENYPISLGIDTIHNSFSISEFHSEFFSKSNCMA